MIELHVEENISKITINRPEKANALSISILDELNEVITEIDNNKASYCTIITGAGNQAFSAGADLKERKTMTDEQVVKTVRYIGETINRIERMRMPTIAALNGVAFGGGLELALACDVRIAANNVKLGLTETTLAIIPGAGGTQRLPRLIGIGHAKRLIYTGLPIIAEEAFQLGIIEEIVPFEKLEEQSFQLAGSIKSNGPLALQQAKLAINQGIEVNLMTGLEIEHLAYQKTIPSQDRKEGLLAFSEKRTPNYKGK